MQLTVSYIDQILVLLVFACSLNVLLGYAGVFNAAAAAFGAIGGYSLVWLTSHHGFSYVPAVVIGVSVAALFGLLVGYAALRLEMLWLLLLTLAVQLVLVGVLTGLTTFGGSSGLQAEGLNLFGHEFVEPTQVFPLVAVSAVVVFLLCYRMGESPYGRVLRAIRDDEVAARSLGKNAFSYKLSVFTITAAIAAFGGALMSTHTSLASPQLFGFAVSIQIIAIVMIGGMGNMIGTVIGVTLVVLLTPFLENVIDLSTNVASLTQQLAYGLALVLIIFFRPQGIIPEGVTLGRRRIARGDGGAMRSSAVARHNGASAPNAPRLVAPIGRDRPDERDAVVVHEISKSFGGIHAVNGLTMELRRGVITALVGPNGAGKTTVFNLLTGALPADSGRVYLDGNDITGLRPDEITRLGMARSFQDVRVFPSLTVRENVMLGVQNLPGDRLRNVFAHPKVTAAAEWGARERADEWLTFIDMLNLANVRAGTLGFGQQKLVALARILATDADVLLLDEPGSGIDHVWIDEMIGVILQLRAAGRTICIVEHNLEVVDRLADHVYFMELGRVTAEGSFADLTNDPRLTEAYFGSV